VAEDIGPLKRDAVGCAPMFKHFKEMNVWLKTVRNATETKKWWKVLAAKLRGHYEHCGVSGNYAGIMAFY